MPHLESQAREPGLYQHRAILRHWWCARKSKLQRKDVWKWKHHADYIILFYIWLSRHCFKNNSLASAGWEGTRRDAWVISEASSPFGGLESLFRLQGGIRMLDINWSFTIFGTMRYQWTSRNGHLRMISGDWHSNFDPSPTWYPSIWFGLNVWTWNVPTLISLIPCLLIVQRFPTIAIQQICYPPSFPSVSHSFLSFSLWYSRVNSSIAVNAPWGVAWARTRARSAQAKWWKWDGLGKCWFGRWFLWMIIGFTPWVNLQFGDGLPSGNLT